MTARKQHKPTMAQVQASFAELVGIWGLACEDDGAHKHATLAGQTETASRHLGVLRTFGHPYPAFVEAERVYLKNLGWWLP